VDTIVFSSPTDALSIRYQTLYRRTGADAEFERGIGAAVTVHAKLECKPT